MPHLLNVTKTLESDTEYRIFLIAVFIILVIALFIWLIKK